MDSNEYNPEIIQKKLEDLDNEVNTFIQVIREVREMKDAAGVLHERLMSQEGEIEHQKKELEQLIATTKNLGINIEEQTKGVIFDLEKKTDTLVSEVKSGISQIGTICEKGSAQLQGQHNETFDYFSNKYEELKKVCEILKTIVDSHEQKISTLNNGHPGDASVFDKMEASLTELKKTMYEIQKRPYEFENKLKKMEEKLELSINEKYSRQKNFTLVVLIILSAAIFLSVMTFFFS
jgi:chromosome segregation ATPase